MTRRAGVALFFLLLAASRLAHIGVLWIEETYPAAGALQILAGKVPYRDFFFDKPPLAAIVPLAWLAHDGLPLRLAGFAFVALVCWIAWRFADDMWGPQEGLLAGALMGFHLTFWTPAAVIPLAPDLLMLAPHLAAIYLAWSGRPFWSGLLAGVALMVNTKGVFVLAAVLIWQYRAIPLVLAGFAAPALVSMTTLAALGALRGYWEQVWWWGSRYSADSYLENALGAGVEKTLSWAAFHATIVLSAAWFWRSVWSEDGRRMMRWAVLMLVPLALGWRWFPRYYFVLLPVFVLAAARGLVVMERWQSIALLLLLIVPAARFGPRYSNVQDPAWNDLAMYRDSRRASDIIRTKAVPSDTLLVWGYRPDIFVMTRLAAGTPFLDSQPLTGVIADRHLVDSRPTFPELATENRRRLAAMRPTWVVDGLGPYNAALSITRYADLSTWLLQYEEAGRSPFAIVYRLRAAAPPSTAR